MKQPALFVLGLALLAGHPTPATATPWKPAANTMLTQWGEKLDPADVWNVYPRPQMERAQWENLNGLWNYAVTAKDAGKPTGWNGEILVPFALEAPLSGVGRKLAPTEALWYQRTFNVAKAGSERLVLHFEAVDYQSEVWVNGKAIGTHTGGNLPFQFDITDAVENGSNEIIVRVLDAADTLGAFQLRGKQVSDNKGIWYTSVSGIWQTVWLESVPENHIDALKIDTKMSGQIKLIPAIAGSGTLRTTAYLGGKPVAQGGSEVSIPNPKLWSPTSPTLYDLKVELVDADGKVLDTVKSYAGLREVGKEKDAAGNWRFTLNGKEIFHWGPLDQGWWPDGLLTPPSEEAMLSDMQYLKDAGFNMIRKHIKVEPRRYYYHCDKMGFLVWQDQVSGGKNPEEWPGWKRLRKMKMEIKTLNADWPDAAHEQWMAELKGMIDHLYNHPSIVVWTPFNERWGQHRTMVVGEWLTQYDPSRSINIASGGNFFPVGDIADEHQYPHPDFPLDDPQYNDFIKVVGEFGGHGWPVEGHVWKLESKNWGYGGLPQTVDEYKDRYATSMKVLGELRQKGVAAGVYTQTTDVEAEINGLLTYDRKIPKIPAEKLKALHEEVGLLK